MQGDENGQYGLKPFKKIVDDANESNFYEIDQNYYGESLSGSYNKSNTKYVFSSYSAD
ncbi:UNVERIFIED_CONTAM: hypothetical protein O8I53_12110 [Campylobacter lari]